MQTGYEPLNTLKPVVEGLWLIDGPAVTRGGAPCPTRASVVQLSCGALWLHAPTTWTTALQAALTAIGPIGHIVVPDGPAQADLTPWVHANAQARIWKVGETWTDVPWANDIQTISVGGSRTHQESAFFHGESATLILSTLVANVDTALLPTWARPFIWFAGIDHPRGGMPPKVRRAFRDRDALAVSIEQMMDLRPRRILLMHGHWYEGGAVAELERVFRKPLRDRQWVRAMEDIKAREG